MPNSHLENGGEQKPKKEMSPSRLRLIGAALASTAVFSGLAAKSVMHDANPKKADAHPVTATVPRAETTTTLVAETLPEASEIDHTVEIAATPEQNNEFQALAESLAASVLDMHDGSLGMYASSDEPEAVARGRKLASDGSGYYDYDMTLPFDDYDPANVRNISVRMIAGQLDEKGLARPDNKIMFSASLYKDETGNWTFETMASDDLVSAGNEQQPFDPKTFAFDAVELAADGAPVA